MLSEARARLANTQGKKAKRKAREKQLESARRLAAHQKRRELKAAGIEINERKKKRGIDYNAGIPFRHKPPPGFWDVTSEVEREERESKSMVNVLLSRLEGQRRSEVEEESRRRDAKKIKIKAESGDYIPRSAMKMLERPAFTERGKINLSEPQVSTDEINSIVKASVSGTAGDMGDGDEDVPTRLLLSNYNIALDSSSISHNISAQTSLTSENNIRMQAKNLKALVESQTPLLGRDIETDGDIDFKTLLPKGTPLPKSSISTTRPIIEHDGTTKGSTVKSTQIRATPLRDKMGINQISGIDGTPVGSEVYGYTSSKYSVDGSTANITQQRKYISELFKTLPAPQNDFEIIIPEAEPELMDEDRNSPEMIEEDASEVLLKTMKKQQEEKQAKLALCSQAVIRKLPRPIVINPESFLAPNGLESGVVPKPQVSESTTAAKGRKGRKLKAKGKASNSKSHDGPAEDIIHSAESVDRLIKKTMYDMLISDAYNYPSPHQQEIPSSQTISPLDVNTFSVDEINNADSLIKEQLNLIKESGKTTPLDDVEKFDKIRADVMSKYCENTAEHYMPVKFLDLDDRDKIKIHRANLLHYRKLAKEGALTARKMESKLVILLSGLQMRSKKLMDDTLDLWQKCDNAARTRDSFLHIQKIENANAEHRIAREKEMRMRFHAS